MRLSIRISALAALAASLFVGLCIPNAAFAAQAPGWQILQSPRPTVFVPGSESSPTRFVPEYELFITNVGGEAASGTIVTDVLPAGVTPSTLTPQYEYHPGPGESSLGEANGPCQVAMSTVTCEVSAPVLPGTSVSVNIPVAVSPTAPATVANEAFVEGGGAVSSSRLDTSIGTVLPAFELLPGPGLSAAVADEAGEVPSAGSHPFLVSINVGVPSVETRGGNWNAVQSLRSVGVELPQGFVVDPQATETLCTQQVLNHSATTNPNVYCPQSSQVGTAYPVSAGLLQHAEEPLYLVEPPPGSAAALAFAIENTTVEILGGVNGGFRLTAKSTELLTRFHIGEITIVLWGVPSDSRHDRSRFGGTRDTPSSCIDDGCTIAPSPAPFISMPTSCSEPAELSATVESWQGTVRSGSRPLTDRNGELAAVSGCNSLAFAPTVESRATTNQGESPSGLDFSIHQMQEESLQGRSTAPLKNAVVTLPEGMTINASAANGLGACTEEQVGYAPENGKIRFSVDPQSCPDSAKVGSLKVKTPLLAEELSGAVYLAKPFDNPFDSLLSIYLAVEDEKSGVVAKLAGKVEPNPSTGRLTATFTENPELPLEDIRLHFFEGAGAALTSPISCGAKTTTTTLTPWSTPEGVDAHPTGSFETTTGCYGSENQAPGTASFTAGAESPLSAAYSPFVLRLSRPDGSQHITGIETTLPEGLLGKLAGVSYCPESGIAQAISREAPEKGKEEQASPSCPPSSEVGQVKVTAGSGISPIAVSGHAYLAGPYKGAPLSLVVIVPAVAGPFDLGTVVDRVALNVGEYDARIHAVADPLPTIKDGIPLDVRSIELKLDRSDFTLNPTSCEAMAIEGSLVTQPGQSVALKNRFQVGECGRLAFKPKIAISLKGPTKKAGLPALTATVTYPSGGAYANIAGAQVSLPHAEFLEQNNIRNACTKPVVQAGQCPASSIYGRVKAWTPLLDKPLEGNVYLVGGYGYKLPALVAELNGQIKVLLVGKIDTGKNKGIRNTFETVPDAPVEKFILQMKGGKKFGLLVNSEDICNKKQIAEVSFTAQNGSSLKLKPKIATSCKTQKHRKKKHKTKSKGKKGSKKG